MQKFRVLDVSRDAAGAIAAYRIVKGTATDGIVAQSAAAADKHVGVNGSIPGALGGDSIDIAVVGIAPVEYGGAVAFGDKLTSDASGRAVVAGAASNVIGVAQEKGVLGTIGSVLLSFSSIPA